MNRTLRLVLGCVVLLAGLGMLVGWYAGRPGQGQLNTMLYHKPSVMTVAYKAYGNPQAATGKYWLSKIVLENTGGGPLRNVKVSYQVPDYITWTTPDEAAELLPGQAAVFTWYPKFPPTITRIRSKTPATLEVKIEYDDGDQVHSRVEKREFALRGVTEFEFTSLPASEIVSYYDYYDNEELTAAYVTDEDPVVKTYYTKVSEAYGGINIITSQKDLVQLARSIYDFMVSTGMTYSGAKGVPETVGDVRSMTQSMRLPRDVIYGNSGLCVELAYLWSALAHTAGAKSKLVFIPGHCFVILESGDGSQLPVECTMIGGGAGGNMEAAGTFDSAVEAAYKTLAKVDETGMPISILDVQEQHLNGIRPPELEDVNRTELVRFLDDLRAGRGNAPMNNQVAMNDPNMGGGGQQPVPPPGPQPPPQPQPQPDPGFDPNPVPPPSPNPNPVPPPGPNPNPVPGPGPGPSPDTSGMTTWSDPRGRVSLPYPSGWMVNAQTVQQIQQYLPGYALSASDAQTFAGVDVVFFDNMDAQNAAQTMLNFFQQMGAQPQTGQAQMVKIAGRDTLTIPLTLSGPGGAIVGAMNFISINGGVVAVSVASPQQATQQSASVFAQILAGIRISG